MGWRGADERGAGHLGVWAVVCGEAQGEPGMQKDKIRTQAISCVQDRSPSVVRGGGSMGLSRVDPAIAAADPGYVLVLWDDIWRWRRCGDAVETLWRRLRDACVTLSSDARHARDIHDHDMDDGHGVEIGMKLGLTSFVCFLVMITRECILSAGQDPSIHSFIPISTSK